MRARVIPVIPAIAAALAAPALALPAAPATAAPTMTTAPGGLYRAVAPQRLLDTRTTSPVGPATTRTVQVAGRAGVPSTGVSAVVLNVTSIAPTAATYVTTFPAGTTRPTVSSLNVRRGETRANLVTVPLSADGRLSLYNSAGTTNLAVDVVGYYAATGDGFITGPAFRVHDTRTLGQPVAPNAVLDIDLGDPSGAQYDSIAINLTAVTPTAPGWLTAYDGARAPGVSTVNFPAGESTPNMAVVPLRRTADAHVHMAVANHSPKPVNVIVDAIGLYGPEGPSAPFRFAPVAPRRIVDTRATGKPLTSGETRDLPVPFLGLGADPTQLVSLVGNATAVTPTAPTYLTLWAGLDYGSRPTASNLNALAGQTVANSAWPEVDIDASTPTFAVFNRAGSTHVLYDVTGYFWMPMPTPYAAKATTQPAPQLRTVSAVQRPVG